MSSAVYLTFQLTEEQAGPFPVSTESLWCLPVGENFRVRNIPFFIDDISFDDVISVTPVSDGVFSVANVVAASKNSTIWVCCRAEEYEAPFTNKLLALGCGVEGGVLKGYYAVNVPADVGIKAVCSVIDEAESAGKIYVDYPSIRH